MNVIAISETMGSRGVEIAGMVATTLGYELADREIIAKAADRFGETPTDVARAVEDKPTLWERLRETQHRYMAYVEATLLDMAASGRVVLVGRGAAFVLGRFPHVLRVRITAPEALRAARVRETQGLTDEGAADWIRDSDSERSSRLKFLYHRDWDDPLLYDLLLNTERIDVAGAAEIIAQTVRQERFQLTPAGRMAIRDASLAATAKATLLAHPLTRQLGIVAKAKEGVLVLSGNVAGDEERAAAEQIVRRLGDVTRVVNEITRLPRLM
jgi:cytidylate kinase